MPQRRAARSEQYVSAIEHLIKVVQGLSLARDMPAVQQVVSLAARKLTGTDGARVVLREGDNCVHVDEDAVAPLWKGWHPSMDTCISDWVMQNRSPALVADIYEDARVPTEVHRPTFVKSVVMVPIRSADPIGAIGNYWGQRHHATQSELDLLQALADSTAMAIESVRIFTNLEEHVRRRTRDLEEANDAIHQLSLVDEMTGLHNRRGFFVLADQARKAAVRSRSQVFLLFVDADGLKKVNDTLGHEAGDEMLRKLGRVLKTTFRQSDIVARLGGDEFCVFGLHEEGDPAAAKARLDANIDAFNARNTGPYRLAASAGMFPFRADDTCTLEAGRCPRRQGDVCGEARAQSGPR